MYNLHVNRTRCMVKCIASVVPKNKYSCVIEQCITPGTIFHYKNFQHYLKSCFPLQHELEKKNEFQHIHNLNISLHVCVL